MSEETTLPESEKTDMTDATDNSLITDFTQVVSCAVAGTAPSAAGRRFAGSWCSSISQAMSSPPYPCSRGCKSCSATVKRD